MSRGHGADALKTKGPGGRQQGPASSHLPRLAPASSSCSPQSCRQTRPAGSNGQLPNRARHKASLPDTTPGEAATLSSLSDGSSRGQKAQSPLVSEDDSIGLIISRPILKAGDSTFCDRDCPGRKSNLGPNAESPRLTDAHRCSDVTEATSGR